MSTESTMTRVRGDSRRSTGRQYSDTGQNDSKARSKGTRSTNSAKPSPPVQEPSSCRRERLPWTATPCRCSDRTYSGCLSMPWRATKSTLQPFSRRKRTRSWSRRPPESRSSCGTAYETTSAFRCVMRLPVPGRGGQAPPRSRPLWNRAAAAAPGAPPRAAPGIAFD